MSKQVGEDNNDDAQVQLTKRLLLDEQAAFERRGVPQAYEPRQDDVLQPVLRIPGSHHIAWSVKKLTLNAP